MQRSISSRRTDHSRRSVGVGLVLLVSGCLGTGSNSDRGGVQALVVDAAPEEAPVVDFGDSPAAENDDLGEVVTETVRTDARSAPASTELQGEEFDAARSALSELPRHDGDDPGYYVRHEGKTVRIQLFVEE